MPVGHDDRTAMGRMSETGTVKSAMMRAREAHAAETSHTTVHTAVGSKTRGHATAPHTSAAALRPADGRNENDEQRVEEETAPHSPIIAPFAGDDGKES